MLLIYKRIDEIEKLLKHKEITSYRIQISTKDKIYIVDKLEEEEQEEVHTNAVGFQIPSKDEEE